MKIKYSTLVILLGSSAVVHAVRVPASEVPGSCTWATTCQSTNYYERSDGTPVITAAGSVEQFFSQGSTSELECDNCNPSTTPMSCTTSLNIQYNASVTVSVASGITAGVPGLTASLTGTLGATNGQVSSFTVTCGSSAVPPLTKTLYKVYMNITKGKKVKLTSTYTCYNQVTISSSGCTLGNVSQQPGGTADSTADGSFGSSTGACKSDPGTCPPTTPQAGE